MRALMDAVRSECSAWSDDLSEEPTVLAVVVLALLLCTGALHSRPMLAARAEMKVFTQRLHGAIHARLPPLLKSTEARAGLAPCDIARL